MSLRAATQRARRLFPEGRALPEEVWQRRHKVMQGLLWFHVAAILVFGVARGYSPVHSAFEASIVGAAAVGAGLRWGRRFRMAMATFGLVSASAILTHLSGGTIEMHFHFFVMIGVITMYQDWFPFLLAIAYVAVHHGLMGALYPNSVYNHPAAVANPWKWAGIHAFFVLGASVAYLVSWRMSETERARAEEYSLQIHDADLRRRQALEINDNIVQGLAVAKYALDAGDEEKSYEAIARTLASARVIIGDLLSGDKNQSNIGPGDLVREQAANLSIDTT